MTTVAAEIKALISAARTAAGMVKVVDSSVALQARIDESVQEVHREVGQVSYAICKGFVAHALGREPAADEVAAFMTAAVNDPAFPNRAFRLLGEARKAASSRRRKFLAAMLFGLPFAKLGDDERDRVDMVVERMIPGDVELLHTIAEKDRTAQSHAESEPYFFAGSKVVAFIQGIEVRIMSTDDAPDGQFGDPTQTGFALEHSAFASLLSLGCIDLGEARASQGAWHIHTLLITPLGRLVIQAIEEVRPGFAGGADEGTER